MATYGLLGEKLSHSYSVPIHLNFGCPEYKLIELSPQALDDFLCKKDFLGVNVTIPYKKTVIPYCDFLSPEAEEIGSVNTIVNRNGKLYGYNTDLYGFIYMVKSAGIDFFGKKVLILGSGGTSLTVKSAAKRLGAAEIVVISRTGKNNYSNLYLHSDCDVLVNTTPVGMYPNCPASPLSLTEFPKLSGVVDVIFNPFRTELIMESEKLSIPSVGGLKMLVAQAKKAEELFFEKEIDESESINVYSKISPAARNIVLIGMPGAGKSTVGAFLSKLTGMTLVDTDNEIEDRTNMAIPEFFSKYGENEFRRVETQVLSQCGKKSGIIISCGGGVVTREENYPLLRQNGRIYEIMRRVSLLDTADRPLSAGDNTLAQMYEIRKPMYRAFRDKSADNNGTVERCASEIWSDFCENSGN